MGPFKVINEEFLFLFASIFKGWDQGKKLTLIFYHLQLQNRSHILKKGP